MIELLNSFINSFIALIENVALAGAFILAAFIACVIVLFLIRIFLGDGPDKWDDPSRKAEWDRMGDAAQQNIRNGKYN